MMFPAIPPDLGELESDDLPLHGWCALTGIGEENVYFRRMSDGATFFIKPPLSYCMDCGRMACYCPGELAR